MFYTCILSSVQSFIHVQLFAALWIAARQASLSITNSWSLLKLMFIESVAVRDVLHLYPHHLSEQLCASISR